MELGADYDRTLHGSLRQQVYAGSRANARSGRPGFRIGVLSRKSGCGDRAPLVAATLITFGLITTGVCDRRWRRKCHFSTGEPDENRVDLDLAPLDSYSGRVTFMPMPSTVLQVLRATCTRRRRNSLPSRDPL